VLTKIFYTCPNPKCQTKFENLILVRDYSKTPADIYYGCPRCLTKLDPTTTQVLEKEELLVEEKTETEQLRSEIDLSSRCPKYFGYLSNHLSDVVNLDECLICQKVLDCMRA
jgi:hypothetical protein